MATGYGFDAQTVFDAEVPKGALLIEIFRADNTAYSKFLFKVPIQRQSSPSICGLSEEALQYQQASGDDELPAGSSGRQDNGGRCRGW